MSSINLGAQVDQPSGISHRQMLCATQKNAGGGFSSRSPAKLR
jgi:hypothetical protein